jgi:hypothetical protein
MKKVFLATCAVVFTALILMSFKADTDKHYGGSANAVVTTYKAIYSPSGAKKGEQIGSYTIDAVVKCEYDNTSAARAALKNEIEYEKINKEKLGEISEFTTSITYYVDSCE